MKVLFLLTSLVAGGTESSTAALLPALRDRGIECEVAVLKREPLGYEQQVRDGGFTVHHIDESTIFRRVRALRGLLRRLEPDILHTAIFDADIVGRLAGWRMPVRVVSSLVNTSYDPARLSDLRVPRWKLRLAQTADAMTARFLTDRMHAVSEGVADANATDMKLRRDRIDVVERGRDPAALRPSSADARERIRSELGIPASTPVVLAVGRVEFQKGHVVLVEAMNLLAAEDMTVSPLALIAGRDGSASDAVAARIRELDVEAHIRLLGHRTDVPDLLAAADAFVLPSRYEGTAGVVIEAMAASVPIVSTDVRGLRGVLEDAVTAVLVPVDNPTALAVALAGVIDGGDAIGQMVESARTRFEATFTIDRSAERMEAFYDRVFAASPRDRRPRGTV